MTHFTDYVSQIKRALDAEKESSAIEIIFDLDSTIFDVSPRISGILNFYGTLPEVISRQPKMAKVLREITPDPKDYGVRRTLLRYPELSITHEEIRALAHFWKLKFFSSEYLHLDVPYPGALEFIETLKTLGLSISYLTGRDVARMKEGTVKSLKSYGLPLTDNHTNLNLKPSKEFLDTEYKNFFLKDTFLDKRHVWFFENEPAIINQIKIIRPDINIVFVNTVHSEKESVRGVVPQLLWAP